MTGMEETVEATSATALLATNGPAKLEPGQVLDERITITALIGHGAMGDVYKAQQRGVDRPVAIKTLQLTRADKEGVARFFREARLLSTLDHPNIVKIYAIGQTESGQPYLVLDYVEGPTLAEIIERGEIDSLEKFLCVFEQLLEALAHAHGRGVVHRDIKPRNIILEPLGTGWKVHLLDFGIARLADGDLNQKLTRTGSIIGSPAYMSPEQCLGRTPDNRSDLYSLACVMYEVLTGKPPFQASSAANLMRAHVADQATTLTKSNTRFAVPPGLFVVVELALQKSADARYQTAGGMLEDLRRISAGAKVTSPAVRKRKKHSAALKPLLAIFAGFLLAAAVLFGLHAYSQSSRLNARERFDQEAEAGRLMQRAIVARFKRHFHQADEYLKEAQKIYEHLGGYEVELVDVYADRAALNHHFGNYAVADRFFKQSIACLPTARANSAERLACLRQEWAMNLMDEHKAAEALPLLQLADEFFSRQPLDSEDRIHARISNLRWLLDASLASGQDNLAASRFPELLKLQSTYGVDLSTRYGTMLEYARTLRRLGRNSEAEHEEALARELHDKHSA